MRESIAQLLLAELRSVLEAHDDELKHGGQVYTDGDRIRAVIANADNEESAREMAQESAMELRADLIHDRHLAGECDSRGVQYNERGI